MTVLASIVRQPRPLAHWARAVCPALVALVLAGCEAAKPGYTPPSFNEKKSGPLAGKPFEAGKLTDESRYQVSDAERKLDCKKLTGSQQIAISRMQARQKSAEPSALASTAQKLSAPLLKHSSANADIAQEVQREQARFKAFNDLLISKGCAPVELPASLRR